MITDDGRCIAEIKKRIGMAKDNFNSMRKLLTSKQITNRLKMRMIKCYIYPILMYGSETWTMNKQLEDRIDAFEMWIYRRIGRVSWTEKQTNKQVLGKLGMKKQLLREIKFRQVKYFGHIKRHDTMIKHLLEGKVKGGRARGRPRDKWEGNFKKWTGYSLAVCNTKAKDRGCWRFIAANLRCGDGT